MTSSSPWALVIVVFCHRSPAVAAFFHWMRPGDAIIVVQCDYGIVPVGAAGMTREEDPANEAWRLGYLPDAGRYGSHRD